MSTIETNNTRVVRVHKDLHEVLEEYNKKFYNGLGKPRAVEKEVATVVKEKILSATTKQSQEAKSFVGRRLV